MIGRFKKFIYSWALGKFIDLEGPAASFSTSHKTQENPRDIETRKRVNKAFDQQEKQMQERAMKAHDPKCEDPTLCKKTLCYQWAPDKIVKVEIESVKFDPLEKRRNNFEAQNEIKRRGRPKKSSE